MQSSSWTSHMVLARMPILWILASVANPGKPRSTTKDVMRSSTRA